ncbi:ATP12 family protein [Acidisoma cladoniae]|jgi:chaperone required for assembly of F1-ATPase|uniref:ATP12 family protein n=1 Tax=Acidisoma cladoniae TaxID=3040935 RepID=UPI00254BF761|nr:ATP12 family protein [Acidisoma sp. PAMC 29798]
MKRFWDRAALAEAEGRFSVLLDGKPMRLPGGESLALAHRPLAEAIVDEWDQAGGGAKGATVTPGLLPMTQLAATATLRIAPAPAETAAAIAAYARADLLCYRAEATPALLAQQDAAWQPWLDWAEKRYGAALLVTRGIGFIDQSPQALAALAAAVAAQDAHALAALGVMVPVLGSLVLGLAIIEGEMNATEAYGLSVIDELYQEERWGRDEDAAAHRARAGDDVSAAATYVRLTRGAA